MDYAQYRGDGVSEVCAMRCAHTSPARRSITARMDARQAISRRPRPVLAWTQVPADPLALTSLGTPFSPQPSPLSRCPCPVTLNQPANRPHDSYPVHQVILLLIWKFPYYITFVFGMSNYSSRQVVWLCTDLNLWILIGPWSQSQSYLDSCKFIHI